MNYTHRYGKNSDIIYPLPIYKFSICQQSLVLEEVPNITVYVVLGRNGLNFKTKMYPTVANQG